jgi:uncharacterized Zn ribbon protein
MSISASDMVAYLKDEARTLTEYYDGFHDVIGKGVARLGLERGISREQFIRLYNGQDPNTGEQLTRIRHKKVTDEEGNVHKVVEHNGMIDIVFGTPKSLSELLVSLKDDPAMQAKVIEVVKQAAISAHHLVERETAFARVPAKLAAKRMRSDGRYTDCTSEYVPAELIAVPVVQFTARDTDTTLDRGVPDAHLHVHVATFTACYVDGRWLTANERPLKTEWNAKIRDAVFLGEIARGLEDLGIALDYKDFERARKGEVSWEVQGSKEEIRRRWSTNTERAWEIRRAFEGEYGRPMPEVDLKRELYRTRKVKSEATKVQDSDPTWQLWADDLQRSGLKLDIPEPTAPIEHNILDDFETLQQRLLGENGFCRDAPTFDEAMIKGSIRRCAVGLGLDQEILDGVERMYLSGKDHELVVARDAIDRSHKLLTTQTFLDVEAWLRDEQARKAADNRLVTLTGAAGTGKTTVGKVVVHALRPLDGGALPEDVEGFLLATAAKLDVQLNDKQLEAAVDMARAAEGSTHFVVAALANATAERTGIGVRADDFGSIDRLHYRISRGDLQLTDKSFVILDEAGQVGTFKAKKFYEMSQNSPIAQFGDSKQLAAISAHGWFTEGIDTHASIELVDVRRQIHPEDVAAYGLMREQRAPEALADLDARGRVVVAESNEERMKALTDRWASLRDAGQPVHRVAMIFDGANIEVDTANRFAQRYRAEHGEIRATWDEQEQRWTGGVTVHRDERRWELYEGDEIIFLDAVRVEGQPPIRAGTTGKIMALNDDGTIRARCHGDNREATVLANGSIGLPYGVHVQVFQGGQVEQALCAPGLTTTQESLYTMASRGIVESHFFISAEHGGIEGIGKFAQRVSEQETATKALARLRDAPTQDLPPLQQDELLLEDIEMEEMPDLDPVIVDEFEPIAPEPRRLDRRRLEPRTLEPRALEPPNISGIEMSGPE